MSDRTRRITDQQLVALARFDERLRAQLRALLTDDLIAEHRARPLGQHSDALERILNYFRRPPRFGLYSRKTCREYQLIALPVARGSVPAPLDETVYTDKDTALHAVFLKHIELLQE